MQNLPVVSHVVERSWDGSSIASVVIVLVFIAAWVATRRFRRR